MQEEPQTPPPIPPQPPALPPALPQPRASIGQDAAIRMLIPVGRSGWAIAAGYFGLFSFILIGAPFALITGILGLLEIRKSRNTPNPKYGMGRAIFGIVTGGIFTLVIIALLLKMVFQKME
jgi:Domain of unknown function (DUF4190)